MATFALAAFVAVPACALLEIAFGLPETRGAGVIAIALIEETAKLAVVVFLLRLKDRPRSDAIALGAMAGVGFAGLEMLAFALAPEQPGSIVLLRTVAAPLAHAMWTTIACCALARTGVSRQLLVALAASVTLHALWDLEPLGGAALVAVYVAILCASAAMVHAALPRARTRAEVTPQPA